MTLDDWCARQRGVDYFEDPGPWPTISIADAHEYGMISAGVPLYFMGDMGEGRKMLRITRIDRAVDGPQGQTFYVLTNTAYPTWCYGQQHVYLIPAGPTETAWWGVFLRMTKQAQELVDTLNLAISAVDTLNAVNSARDAGGDGPGEVKGE